MGEIPNLVYFITTDEKMTAVQFHGRKKITQPSDHISKVHPQMNTHYFSATFNKKNYFKNSGLIYLPVATKKKHPTAVAVQAHVASSI